MKDSGYKEGQDTLRKLMGTHPNDQPKLETEFFIGVEGIDVKMIDWPMNPYKAMYVLGTTCWGKKVDKWKETEPKYRFEVVKAVLKRKALPLAMEAPKFTFVIEGPSRAAFDQIARLRIGTVFSARGMRDNNWKGCSFRIPNNLNNQPAVKRLVEGIKGDYAFLVEEGENCWQAARCILPLNICYGWSMSINYAALSGFCAKRLKFCEQEDTVATAWMMREALGKKFPLLANYLRPGCDFAGRCQYHEAYSLSEKFGCLFKACGRNPVKEGTVDTEYAQFNEACSDRKTIEEQLGIGIPEPGVDGFYGNYMELSKLDKELFDAD